MSFVIYSDFTKERKSDKLILNKNNILFNTLEGRYMKGLSELSFVRTVISDSLINMTHIFILCCLFKTRMDI